MPVVVEYKLADHVRHIIKKFDAFAKIDHSGLVSSHKFAPAGDPAILSESRYAGMGLWQVLKAEFENSKSDDPAKRAQAEEVFKNFNKFSIEFKQEHTVTIFEALFGYFRTVPEANSLINFINFTIYKPFCIIEIEPIDGFDNAELLLRHIITALHALNPAEYGIPSNVGDDIILKQSREYANPINPLLSYYHTPPRHGFNLGSERKLNFNLRPIERSIAAAAGSLAAKSDITEEWYEPFADMYVLDDRKDFKWQIIGKWLDTSLALVACLQRLHQANRINRTLARSVSKDGYIGTAFRKNTSGEVKILAGDEYTQLRMRKDTTLQLEPGQTEIVAGVLEFEGAYGYANIPAAPELRPRFGTAQTCIFSKAADVYALGRILEHSLKEVAKMLFYSKVDDATLLQLIDDINAKVIAPMRLDDRAARASLDTCRDLLLNYQKDSLRFAEAAPRKVAARPQM